MKIILACLICLVSSPVMGQWRAIKVSSATDTNAITENFRRASIWSNRKLDRFSNDTLFGQPIFQNGIKFGDGTIQNTAIISTLSYVQKIGDTMTGQLTIAGSSLTVAGVAQSSGFITGVSTHTRICLSGDCLDMWPMQGTDLFFTSEASSVPPALKMSTANPDGQASTSTITTSASNVIISTYIFTGFTASFINAGFWHIHSHATVSATLGNLSASVYYKVFKSSGTVGAVETLLLQTEKSPLLDTNINNSDIDAHGYTEDMSWTPGDAIIIRSYTSMSGSGAVPTISTYRAGLYQSRLETPGSNFSFGGGGGGVTSIIAGTGISLSPTSGVGDVTVTATSGGGDVFKASTQTFTGSNTFTGAVSLPTRDKITFASQPNSVITDLALMTITQTSAVLCVSTITLTTYGGNVLYGYSGSGYNATASIGYVHAKIDGVAPGGNGSHLASASNTAGGRINLSFSRIEGLAAGTHNICLSFFTGAGTLNMNDTGNGFLGRFWAMELR